MLFKKTRRSDMVNKLPHGEKGAFLEKVRKPKASEKVHLDSAVG